jgi:hypothetical protein
MAGSHASDDRHATGEKMENTLMSKVLEVTTRSPGAVSLVPWLSVRDGARGEVLCVGIGGDGGLLRALVPGLHMRMILFDFPYPLHDTGNLNLTGSQQSS